MKKPSPATILPLLSLLPTTAAITWQFDSSTLTCDGSPFSDASISVLCDGSPSCTLGDTARIAGNLTASSAFDAGAYVVLRPCVSGYCPAGYAHKAGGACEEWLAPRDADAECGSAGEYDVDYSLAIPNKLPDYLSWLSAVSDAITVKVVMTSEVECQANADSYYNDGAGYQMVYGMLGLSAALLGVGASVRRSWGKEDGEKEKRVDEKEGTYGGDYIEMLSGKGAVV